MKIAEVHQSNAMRGGGGGERRADGINSPAVKSDKCADAGKPACTASAAPALKSAPARTAAARAARADAAAAHAHERRTDI
jgi:hypothetical protein